MSQTPFDINNDHDTAMILTTLAFATLCSVQDPVPEVPAGLFIERPTVVVDADLDPLRFHLIPPGPGPVTPEVFAQLVPRFDPVALFGNPPPPIELGSFSSGTARIVADLQGRAVIDGLIEWGFLQYSLSEVHDGSDPLYKNEQEAEGGIGGDIFSFWLPGSEGTIPEEFVGVIEKARDGLDMGTAGIRGMDHMMHALALDPDIAEDAEEAITTFYFTVTALTVSAAPEAWFGGDPDERSSATILKVEWDAGEQKWCPPTIHLDYEDLKLDKDDEITCLAVDRPNQKVLLGTNTTGKQLWVGVYHDNWTVSDYADVYRDAGGGTFSATELRLNPSDRFSGICAGDPGADAPEGLIIMRTLGIPQEDGTARPCYEIAASRAYDGGSDLIHVYLGNLLCMSNTAMTSSLTVVLSGTCTGSFVVRPRDRYDVFRYTVEVPRTLPPTLDPWRFKWTVMTPRGLLVSTHAVEIWP